MARFCLRVFGCQMNQHDAEKIANLLRHEGYSEAERPDGADVVVIHTCSVRDKAEQKLYSELGALLELKDARPGLLIGVGGCVAQQEGGRLLRRFPLLDFVFGPQNLRHLPAMLADARRHQRGLHVGYEDDPQARFDLPALHPEVARRTPGRAFVTVMEGCDLLCSFCVVPATRGREVSRPARDIVEEVRRRAGEGAREITLLGQTVNAYGRPRPGRAPGEVSFAELIERVAAVPGVARVRFTSPHPIFVSDALLEAYASVPELCPHIHLPVQSGSSRVLAAMRRRYDRERYLEIVEGLRRARPDIAITTDLIVGFPGETDEDFEQTLSLCRTVRFTDAFSFRYSPRPGTPAVRRGLEPVDPERVAARHDALGALLRELTLEAHDARVGERTLVLVEGPSRRGGRQQTGRCPYNRIVNLIAEPPLEPGDLALVTVSGATPHSLLAAPPAPGDTLVLPLAQAPGPPGAGEREGAP